MTGRLLICTDLDRTLIPNGPQPESPEARTYFAALVNRDQVKLSYVTGRHRALVEQAMSSYRLPMPDFVIGDVGTSIYRIGHKGDWTPRDDWQRRIGADWSGASAGDLAGVLSGMSFLRLQEPSKQGRFKLSFYVPLHASPDELIEAARDRLTNAGIRASLIWSIDEPAGVGLLDVLPARASKYHAIEFLLENEGFEVDATVFAGDSGNDMEPLTSPIPAVLVANADPTVREQARRIASQNGQVDRLYCAGGGFLGFNGNYSAGILEGVAHYHPDVHDWLEGTMRAQ